MLYLCCTALENHNKELENLKYSIKIPIKQSQLITRDHCACDIKFVASNRVHMAHICE